MAISNENHDIFSSAIDELATAKARLADWLASDASAIREDDVKTIDWVISTINSEAVAADDCLVDDDEDELIASAAQRVDTLERVRIVLADLVNLYIKTKTIHTLTDVVDCVDASKECFNKVRALR